jgi:hypothetical protein
MKEYVVVTFLKPETDPVFKRSAWPVHLTVAGPFFSELEFEPLAQKLKTLCADWKPIVVRGTKRNMFGLRNDVPVTEAERTQELLDFHTKIIDTLNADIRLKVTQHSKAGFMPHVTDRGDVKISPGDAFTLDSISLIELFKDKGFILATIPLV